MLDAICITIAILLWRILIGWFTATIVTIETRFLALKSLMLTNFQQGENNCVFVLTDAPNLKYHLKKIAK